MPARDFDDQEDAKTRGDGADPSAADALTRALCRVWNAATDAATSPDFKGNEEAKIRYRESILAEARTLIAEPPGPSSAAMRLSYEAEAGKPWIDGDPFCALFERSWRASWESAYRWAPTMAAAMAESVEAKYRHGRTATGVEPA